MRESTKLLLFTVWHTLVALYATVAVVVQLVPQVEMWGPWYVHFTFLTLALATILIWLTFWRSMAQEADVGR